MRIGTPLTPSATRVMLLGAGELGKEVIIAFQRLGVEVIAVDRYAHAPGHALAHRAHVLDMTDGPALRALIIRERPHWVIPEIEAIATETLCELESEGLTQVIPTAEAAWLTMQREGIRRLAAEELNLPTSGYAFADSEDELRAAINGGIGLPCVVKPVMSSSGKGQSVVRSERDVAAAWTHAAVDGWIAGASSPSNGSISILKSRCSPSERWMLQGTSKPASANPSGIVRSTATMSKAGSHNRCSQLRSSERATSPAASPRASADAAFSAWSCSFAVMRCGSARSARARTTPGW